MEVNVSDLLGLPYVEHGRSAKDGGFDCYGLAIEVERRYGIKMPDFNYLKHTDELIDTESKNIIDSRKVRKIPELVDGALVLFKNHCGMSTHIGVYIGNNQIIHCPYTGVRIDSVLSLKRKIEGVYVWQK